MDITTVKQTVKQYLSLKSEIDLLTDRSNELKTRLKANVQELGKTNENGHVVLEFDDVRLTNQRKVSNPLDMDIAEELLKERNIYDKCVKMVPILQENEILDCVYTGELSENDIDEMFTKKISYAFIVKEL